ncbi:hypothetical protein IFM51744_09097 [Aspergillus udagawae]|nr:hypothetical protein IFM51744_09097 [Aspergillus udagawae]
MVELTSNPIDNTGLSEGFDGQVSEPSPFSTLSSTLHLPPPTDPPAKLLLAASRDLPWLLQILANDAIQVIGIKRSKRRDNRIDDILLPEGKATPSNEQKLLRGLAQRSMGIQLTQIQRKAQDVAKGKGTPQGKTRVDELCDGIRLADSQTRSCIQKRTGSISKMLHHFNFDPEDKETVLRSINAGVKQLVLEKLVGIWLQQSGRPNRPESVSAIAALNILYFKNLRFEDIPRFVDLLSLPFSNAEFPLASVAGWPHSRVTKHFAIADIIVALSPQFSYFQKEYDTQSSTASPRVATKPADRDITASYPSVSIEPLRNHYALPNQPHADAVTDFDITLGQTQLSQASFYGPHEQVMNDFDITLGQTQLSQAPLYEPQELMNNFDITLGQTQLSLAPLYEPHERALSDFGITTGYALFPQTSSTDLHERMTNDINITEGHAPFARMPSHCSALGRRPTRFPKAPATEHDSVATISRQIKHGPKTFQRLLWAGYGQRHNPYGIVKSNSASFTQMLYCAPHHPVPTPWIWADKPKHLRKSIRIELKKLQDDKQAQEGTLKHTSAIAKQDVSPNYFSQEVLRILEREIPKLNRNQSPDYPSTPGFGPSSSSARAHQVPSIESSSPPRLNAGGQETGLPSQLQEVSEQGPEAPCRLADGVSSTVAAAVAPPQCSGCRK